MPDSKGRYFNQTEQKLVLELLHARRDVRGNKFLDKAIDPEHIDIILEAAAAAPSVGLSQPWKFLLIDDANIKEQVHKNCMEQREISVERFSAERKEKYNNLKLEGIKEAPLNMAVFYDPPDEPIIGNNTMEEMGSYSVVCAIQNMWLMSRSLNIGMGWVSIISPQVIKDILNAPDDYKLIGYLCFGYVTDFYEKPELEVLGWESRKPLEGFVETNKFKEQKK